MRGPHEGTPMRRVIVGVLACAAVAGVAGAQSGGRIQATHLRLDAVDLTEAVQGELTFFASLMDGHGQPLSATDPALWGVAVDGEPIDGELKVSTLEQSTASLAVAVVFQADIASKENGAFEHAQLGVSKLLNGLRDRDLSYVVAFDGKTIVSTQALSPKHSDAVSWVSKEVTPNGATPYLSAAIQKGLDAFPGDFRSVSPNRAMIVVSDGFDGEQANKLNAAYARIKQVASDRNVRVHVIGNAIETANPHDEQLKRLRDLADATGGTVWAATEPAKIEFELEKTLKVLMGQHVVRIQSTDYPDDKSVTFTVNAKYGGQDYTSNAAIMHVPERESHIWGWVAAGAGGLVGLGLLFFIGRSLVRLIASRRGEEEEVDLGPATTTCRQCSNQVPVDWKVCKYCEALPHYGRLVVRSSGPLNGRTFFIKETLTNIGSADGNGVVLREPSVSKRHAGIKVQDNRFELADFGSTNGVFINDQRITKQFLKDRDVLSIGMVEIEFQLKK